MHKIPPTEMYGLGIIVGFEKDIAGNLEIMNFFDCMYQETGVEGKRSNLCGQKHSC